MQNSKLLASLTLLAIGLSLSSGVSSWFDGLPWANAAESLTIIIFIPFLIVIGYRFLSTKLSILLLAALLTLKLILCLGAPASGWKVKVAPSLTKLESGEFIKTYFTVWQENISAILKKGWTDKKEFPLDWFTPLSEDAIEPLNIVKGTLEKKFKQLSLWMSVEGVIRLAPGTKLVVLTKGTAYEELFAVSMEEVKYPIPIVHQYEDIKSLDNTFTPIRAGSISGKFNYSGEVWSFQPYIVDPDGTIKPVSGNDVLWQETAVLNFSDLSLKFFQFLGYTFDYGIIIFLFIWSIWCIQRLWVGNILSLQIVLFSFLAIILPWVLSPIAGKFAWVLLSVKLTPFPVINPQYLALSILLSGIIFITNSSYQVKSKYSNPGQLVFLLFGPAFFLFFAFKWWPDIEHISLWTLGDDWTTYQILAKLIVIEGQWLEAGEPVFHHQPLYRYIVAFFHWLFGPSSFALRMTDIWFTLGTALVLIHLATRLHLSQLSSFLASFLFLIVAIEELIHIGNGLAEFAAMFFIMVACLIISKRPTSIGQVLFAGSIATLGCWLHLDRIGIAGGIACFFIKPESGNLSIAWRSFSQGIKINWKLIAIYLTILALGLIAIILRNGLVGGIFGFVTSDHPNFTGELLWVNLYLLLTGQVWPNLPTDTLVLTMVLLPGTIMGLVALVWRPKFLADFPLSLSIAMLGLLSPYLFLHIWGYPPRYSSQLLPLAALSLGIVLNAFLKERREAR